ATSWHKHATLAIPVPFWHLNHRLEIAPTETPVGGHPYRKFGFIPKRSSDVAPPDDLSTYGPLVNSQVSPSHCLMKTCRSDPYVTSPQPAAGLPATTAR